MASSSGVIANRADVVAPGRVVPPIRGQRSVRAMEIVAGSMLACIGLVAVVGPYVVPYPPDEELLQQGVLLAPGMSGHILGTDQLGRDVLSRLIVGTRVSLELAVAAVIVGLFLGAVVGLVASYRGGWIDVALMRLVDGLLAFPMIVLALIIAAALGPGFGNTLIAVSVAQVPGFARLIRAQSLRVMSSDYVRASKAMAAGPSRIVFADVLPNIWGPVLAQGLLAIGSTIPAAATLSFLGLGVQPPTPDWGNMIATGFQVLGRAPWELLFASIAIVLTVSAASLVGDALHRRFQ